MIGNCRGLFKHKITFLFHKFGIEKRVKKEEREVDDIVTDDGGSVKLMEEITMDRNGRATGNFVAKTFILFNGN